MFIPVSPKTSVEIVGGTNEMLNIVSNLPNRSAVVGEVILYPVSQTLVIVECRTLWVGHRDISLFGGLLSTWIDPVGLNVTPR
jgi:hypothetical protein